VIGNFPTALSFVLDREGGYSENAEDPGGPTNHGITQRTYDKWKLYNGAPRRPVIEISADEIRVIYHDWYWQPIFGDELPDKVDVVTFDAAVNLGVMPAVRILQRSAWVEEDGIMGSETMAAVRSIPPDLICWASLTLRRLHYIEKRRSPFIAGWLNRVAALRQNVSV
jgi:lysozyme family protein